MRNQKIALTSWDALDDSQKTYRVGISDNHVRAIWRLSRVIMPDYSFMSLRDREAVIRGE